MIKKRVNISRNISCCPHFTSKEIPGYSILLETELTPGLLNTERRLTWKFSSTLQGIEPEASSLVVQCLNQLRRRWYTRWKFLQKVNFVNLYLLNVYVGETDTPHAVLSSDTARLQLRRFLNSQNNSSWPAEKPSESTKCHYTLWCVVCYMCY